MIIWSTFKTVKAASMAKRNALNLVERMSTTALSFKIPTVVPSALVELKEEPFKPPSISTPAMAFPLACAALKPAKTTAASKPAFSAKILGTNSKAFPKDRMAY
eukprot:229368_1